MTFFSAIMQDENEGFTGDVIAAGSNAFQQQTVETLSLWHSQTERSF